VNPLPERRRPARPLYAAPEPKRKAAKKPTKKAAKKAAAKDQEGES